MVVIRVLQGLCEGVTFPCIQDVWFYWAPIPERSRMTSIAYTGMLIGTAFTMPISAFLATSVGWESIFYVFGLNFLLYINKYYWVENVFFIGAFGVLWHITWMLVVRATPASDTFISKDELDYILSTTSHTVEKRRSIPWRSLMSSKPVYAIVAANATDNWGFYTMLTQIPSFLSGSLILKVKCKYLSITFIKCIFRRS